MSREDDRDRRDPFSGRGARPDRSQTVRDEAAARSDVTALRSDRSNVVNLADRRARAAEPALAEVVPLPLDGLESVASSTVSPLDCDETPDGAFLRAIAAEIEPEQVGRLVECVFQPDQLGEAALILANAGLSARQTVRVLSLFGMEADTIRAALLSGHPHYDDPGLGAQPLYPADEVDAALGLLTSDGRRGAVRDVGSGHDLAGAADTDNARLIVRAHRGGAEPARVAALAYGLGLTTAETVRVCAHHGFEPSAAVAIALAMNDGDARAAVADVVAEFPEPLGGWERHLHPSMVGLTEPPGSRDAIQEILDGWAGRGVRLTLVQEHLPTPVLPHLPFP